MKVDGQNPTTLAATGWASIPPPMLVPETKNVAARMLGFRVEFVIYFTIIIGL
jgi:hypothetical protein